MHNCEPNTFKNQIVAASVKIIWNSCIQDFGKISRKCKTDITRGCYTNTTKINCFQNKYYCLGQNVINSRLSLIYLSTRVYKSNYSFCPFRLKNFGKRRFKRNNLMIRGHSGYHSSLTISRTPWFLCIFLMLDMFYIIITETFQFIIPSGLNILIYVFITCRIS